MEKLLADPEFNDFDGFQVSSPKVASRSGQLLTMSPLVELKLETMDAPVSVKRAAAAVEAFNQKFASKDQEDEECVTNNLWVVRLPI